MKKEPTYPNLNETVRRGWVPTRHGECLNCYNFTNMGGVSYCISANVNHTGRYVAIEHQ